MDVGRFVTSAREAKTGSEPLTRVSMVCSVRNHFCKRTRPEDGGNGRFVPDMSGARVKSQVYLSAHLDKEIMRPMSRVSVEVK